MATQIVKEGNNFRVWSQVFSSESAAQKALKRVSTSQIQTGKVKIPTISQSIQVAAKNWMSATDIAKKANQAADKWDTYEQNQWADAQAKIQSLRNIWAMADNINAQDNMEDGAPTTEWPQGVDPLNDSVTAEPQELDPNTWLPIESSTASSWWQIAWWSGAGWWSGGAMWGNQNQWSSGASGWWSNAGSTALWMWQVAWGWAVMAANDSQIGMIIPNANAPIENQAASNAAWAAMDQNNINKIKDNPNLWLANSPDSDFWNKFWNPAVDQEWQLPWYMNERNKVVASSLMLKNPNMKAMSDSERKNLIIQDIIQRQWQALDPTIIDRYNTTATNINNLITREIPPYTSNDFFSMLLKGQNISASMAENQTNPSYVSAKTRYDNLQKFSSMNTSQMSDAIKSGALTKGTVLWNDLLDKGMWQIMNDAYSAYTTNMSWNIVNKVLSDILDFDPDVSLALQASGDLDLWTNLETAISLKILQTMKEDQLPTLATYLAADPEVQQSKAAARKSEEALNKLSEEINSFSDDIKTTVVERGGEATGDPFLEAYIQEKTKPFVKRWETLNSQYRNEIAKLDNASENAKLAFEIKEYNKNLEIKGYEFVLDSLYKQNQAKAAQEQAAYEMAKDERDFAYKVGKDERDYALDLAKFKLSAAKWGGWSGWSSVNPESILKGIYNGTLSTSSILNSKTLTSLWLSDMSRADQVNTITDAMLRTYVNKDSSYDEIDTVLWSLSKAFGKDLSTDTMLSYVNKATSPTKALNSFLKSNKFTELVDDEDYDALSSGILAATGGRSLNESQLKWTLMEKLGDRKAVNNILDQVGVKKVTRWEDVTKY